jgi:hypothetical protein
MDVKYCLMVSRIFAHSGRRRVATGADCEAHGGEARGGEARGGEARGGAT